MDTTILQIPIRKDVKDRARTTAEEMGFSSLQEAVRIFLNKMANGSVALKFEESIHLSPEAVRRYNKISEDIESGKEVLYEAKNTEDFLDQLYGRKDPVQSKIFKKLQKKSSAQSQPFG